MTSDIGVLVWPGARLMDGRSVGDTWLEQIYLSFGPVIHRRCLALLGDRAEAEDAMQDVFVRLAERRRQFRGDADILTWVYRITTNLCLNRLRYLRYRRPTDGAESAEPSSSPESAVEGRITVARLFEALDPVDVQIAVHTHFDGMTQSEIAAVVGLSERSVRTHLRHIERVARGLLGPIEDWGRAQP